MSDWGITLINEADSAEDLRNRKPFRQYKLDTFQPNGLNEHEVTLSWRFVATIIPPSKKSSLSMKKAGKMLMEVLLRKGRKITVHGFMRLTIDDTRFQKTLEVLYIFSRGFWFE